MTNKEKTEIKENKHLKNVEKFFYAFAFCSLILIAFKLCYENYYGSLKKITKEIPHEEILKQDIKDIEIAFKKFKDAKIVKKNTGFTFTQVVDGHYNGEFVKGSLYKTINYNKPSLACIGIYDISFKKNDKSISLEMYKKDTLKYHPEKLFECIATAIMDLDDSYNYMKSKEKRELDEKLEQNNNQKAWELY